jgi:hypothetical protein
MGSDCEGETNLRARVRETGFSPATETTDRLSQAILPHRIPIRKMGFSEFDHRKERRRPKEAASNTIVGEH